MMRNLLLKAVLPGVLALGMGVAAGLGYGQLLMSNERRIHEGKVGELTKKLTVLQKRYSEEHDLRVGLEGQKRSLQSELERIRQEHAAMRDDTEVLKQQIGVHEARNRELGEALAQAWRSWQEKIQQMAGAVRERDEALKELTALRRRLEAELQGVRQDFERCGANNAKLCAIAEDLIEAYRRKGVFRSLLQNEPLTQINKVELEHMVQSYRVLIEKEKITPSAKEKE